MKLLSNSEVERFIEEQIPTETITRKKKLRSFIRSGESDYEGN